MIITRVKAVLSATAAHPRRSPTSPRWPFPGWLDPAHVEVVPCGPHVPTPNRIGLTTGTATRVVA
jgi:hypothetical protein